MKHSFYSLLRNNLASTAKFYLIFLVTPLTRKLQQSELQHHDKDAFNKIYGYLIRFLNWFCQGLITVAYPAMGYNPLQSRSHQLESMWASQFLGVASPQLEEEAKKSITRIQDTPSSCKEHLQAIPHFTILICFHHHLNFFKSCLNSIKEACIQSPSTKVEILIINDDPSISSSSLLAQASTLLQEKITLHFHEKNLGICYSANQAIACAKGEWILHLDCDDRLTPNVFSILEQTIQQKPEIRYISSRAIDIDEKGNILSWRLRSEFPRDLINNNVASHLKVIRKDLHDDLGLFNPLFEGCQDYEFALRTAINEPLCFIPDYLYEYRWHDQSQTVSNNKSQNLTANRIRQIYLLSLYWINHGIKNIHWEISGVHAASWCKHLGESPKELSSPGGYAVMLEATTSFQEQQWKLLLVHVATAVIDLYRNHHKSGTISVTL
jgi:glycosyltransferase involved in cell wall biosynthesis